MEGHTCVLLNTCEESRQTKRTAWTSMKKDSWMSSSGQPRKVPENCEDLTFQPAVEQMTPLEGEGETASSTEIGGSSSWRGHGASIGHQALAEIPYGETAGSPQFKRSRLEETLEDEQEKTGEDETELVGPEDILMTKSQGEPDSSTASSILDERQYDHEISFHQLPEGDVPLYQEAERVQWDEWVTHDQSKCIPPEEAAKIRQQVP